MIFVVNISICKYTAFLRKKQIFNKNHTTLSSHILFVSVKNQSYIKPKPNTYLSSYPGLRPPL